jgi:hypothetical protein
MATKTEKLSAKRKAAKAKRERMRRKMGKDKTMNKSTTAAAFILATLAMGCQNTDPASRSNRAAYRDIARVDVRGNGHVVNLHTTVGDGLYASADGGGDAQDTRPTQTVDTRPEVAVALPGGGAGTGGASPQAGVAGAALTKLMGILAGKGGTLTAGEAQAVKDCADGNCAD